MARTIVEKILSNHSGRDLRVGEVGICNVDFCFAQDSSTPLTIESFYQLGQSEVFDKNKIAIVFDHYSPSPNIAVSDMHKKIREFAKDKGIKIFDVGEGVANQLIAERGFITAGDLVLGADSHTCTYGALNILACGIGSTDLAITLASGKNWLRVPETISITVNGKLPVGVYSKDIILHIIKDIGPKGANYKAIEFYGDTINKLSVEGRLTITSMSVEMGAKCSIMEMDQKVEKWFKKHDNKVPNAVFADDNASYCNKKEYDVTALCPLVAKPHSVDNVVPVEDITDVNIAQGFIGTCTNGRLEDLSIAAAILKGKTVHPKVKLIIAPVSRGVFAEAMKRGLVEIFVEAGAIIVAPGIGPSVGTHNGVPADGENVISTSNRNFKGRMGNPNANIYLASPATVAASCIEGKIADPRKYKRKLS
ncbi:MAG: 3-isopropylmalate dehydratase large subunit [Candidatus Omnitrophica bacterium]|nr:3-isopropylmalate dehydratase large subunit [Candidatus Omnitrophota bacterium]